MKGLYQGMCGGSCCETYHYPDAERGIAEEEATAHFLASLAVSFATVWGTKAAGA